MLRSTDFFLQVYDRGHKMVSLEEGQGSRPLVPFEDLLITLSGSKFKTNVNTKILNHHQYLHYHFSLLEYTKRSVAFSQE